MNRDRYRTIFSKRLGMLVAVAETTRVRTKGSGHGAGSGVLVARRTGHSGCVAPIALAVGFALWGEAAFAGPPLPTGGVVTNGTGTISESGNTLTVNQSSQSLSANWQSFDIDAGHTVVFNQPSSSSVALNRVIGPNASSIYGSLSANGKVFLVNPNGVLFAPGSQVSVGGLAAATLSISDEDFAAGRYRFTSGTGAGSVVNQGDIKADSVALIAPKVINSGTISTPGGNTTLAAGERVTVSVLDGLLTAQVDASVLDAEIQNHGQIVAEGGRVSMLAGRADTVLNSLINTDGVVEAKGIRNENGKIYLDAGAGGAAYVNGALDASATNGGNGGEVRVLGERVTLGSGATVDVSGQRSGGTALIGGDYQGKNPDVLNARVTTLEAGAAIRADGAEQGGRAIVWSDDMTRVEGEISARGKGFTEVSGKGTLRFSGKVDTGGGTLLLDPANITVQNAAGDQVNTFSGAQIATLLTSNDVILNADNNITWNAGVALDYNGIGSIGRTLTLQAGNNIAYSGTISDSVAGGDTLNVVFNADHDASGVGGINIANSSSILTSGGDIVLIGGNSALSALPAFTDVGYEGALRATAARGIAIGSATLNAGGGNIAARAVGVDGISNGVGVSLVGTTLQTNGSGAITIDGIGGAGTNFNRGIFTSAVNLSTVNGALTLQGIGGGSGSENIGVRINTGSTVQTTGSGNLIVNALGSTGGDYNDGIVIDGATVRVNTSDLAITGTGRGTGVGSDGVELANSSVVEATSSGNVTLNGTSIATGSNTNRGVTVWLSSTVRSGTGALTLQGSSANAAKGNGISLEATGTIGGAGQSGGITLTADTMNLASAAVLGTGTLLLQPLTSATSIGLGTGATGTFNLTSAELGVLQNGFSSVAIGRSDSSGAVDVRTAAFLDPVTIRTPVGSGSIAVNGTLSTGAGTSAGSIALQAGGDVSLNSGTVSTTDAINLTGTSYTVTGNSALTSNTLAFGNTNGISNAGTLTFNQTVNTTLANAISGTGGNLVKAGANALTLTGNNTYSGTTTISAGTLQVGSGGTTGTLGTGAVTDNGTLTFNRSDDLAQSGAIGGTGNLVKVGTNTLTLTANNTYSGTTTISAGTLQVGSGGTAGTLGSGTVTNNGTLTFNRSDALTQSGAIGGTGNLVKLGAGTVTLSSANTYSGSTTISTGTLALQNTNSSPSYSIASGAVLEINVATGTRSMPTATFSGAGTLRKTGAGQLQWGLSAATFQLSSGALIDVQAGTFVGGSSANEVWLNNLADLNVASGATFNGVEANVRVDALTGGGAISSSLACCGYTGFTFGVDGGSGTFSGVLSGLNFIKAGTGTQVLTGANTYTGTTAVNAGTLAITNANGLGTTAGGTTVESGATLDLRNVAVGAEAITLNGGTLATSTGSSSLTGTVALGTGGGTLAVGGTQLTLSGVISGSTSLTKTGAGTATLAGTNTHTGQTNVNGGTLAVSNNSGLGDTAGSTIVDTGATLELRDVAVSESVVLLGTGTLLVGSGTSSVAGSLSLTGTDTSSVNVASGAQLTLSGVMASGGSLNKDGGGTFVLTGNNANTGAVNINAGTLQVGSGGTSGALGSGTITNNGSLVFNRSDALTVANAIGGTGTLTQAGSGTTSLGGSNTYSGVTTISAGTLQIGNGGTTGTLGSAAVVNNGSLAFNRSDALTLANTISGTGTVTQAGAGTTTLTGTNTYSGVTAVNAGTLAITNAAALGDTTGGTTVAAGAALDLQNVAVGAEGVTLAGGALRTSVGTSSLSGAVALPSTSVFDVRPGAELTVSGVISGSGGLTKISSGTLVLSGANDYTGLTNLSIGGGTLAVTNDSALGSTSAGVSLRAGTTLELRNVTIADSIVANTGDILVSTGASTLSGNISGFNSLPLNVLSGAQLTMTGVTVGPGGLVKNGGGTLTLTGNNTSPGVTTINAGTVRVGDGGTTGTLTRGAVTVASGANLIFDRSDSVSLSTLANNAAGITGAGNVSALIGGGFTVDRPITLSGANSSILLEAGKNIAAGDVSGGDVTLTSNISTSASGTVTIFSGNASTAAYEAKVSGATGATRYKTYNASASNTSGAISGTRNYYYRQQPSTLSVSGLTASKVYDGLLDATSALDSSAATVLGLIDGDTLDYGDLTVTGASFDNAHAGTRALNVSFGGGATPSYASGGATWSISGYGLNSTYSNATAGTITPRSISTSINAVGKTYDGLTSTTSTLSSPSGFVGNDGATGIGGLLLAFDNPSAGMRNVVATGTASLTDFAGVASGNGSGIGTGNEVAGLASDYSIVAPSPVSAVIGQAPLTITANNDAKLITQSDAAGYNGTSYSGFVHGETAADLSGSLSITRTNAGTETAGNYTGVLAPAGYSSGNYAISYVNGNYQILPAQQLLIKVGNVTGAYGALSNYVVTSAQYVDGSGAALRALTETAHNGNTYTYSDGLGGSVTFTISPQGAVMSSAGYLAVGNYGLAGTNASITGNNFVGLNFIGNQSVSQLALMPNATGVSKVYDGTTGLTGLTMGLAGRLTGDVVLVDANGAFSSRNAGINRSYDINNIALSGADAGNYYLTWGALSGSDGLITPKTITAGGITANSKVYDGTNIATLTMAGYAFNGLVTGDTVTLDAASYGALFDSRNVGRGRAVSVSGLGLSGADAGNYILTQPTGLAANITPRPLTITAGTNIKYYDATTNALAIPTMSGTLAGSDSITLFGQRYASAEIGSGLTLIPFAAINDGNGGNNYALTFVNDTTGVIQQHPVDVVEGVGSSAASSLDEALATASRSDRAAGEGTHRVICASDDAENCLIDRSSVPRVISSGIKLPQGVVSALDGSRDLRW